MKYLFLLTFLNLLSPPHDIAMAIFEVTLTKNEIQLRIKLDIDDINTSLQLTPEKTPTKELITKYLKKHTIWLINNQLTTFDAISIEKNEEFYLVETAPIQFNDAFTTIDLHNTTLIESVDKQSNVIYIKQHGKEVRGFRMTKDRVQISVNL